MYHGLPLPSFWDPCIRVHLCSLSCASLFSPVSQKVCSRDGLFSESDFCRFLFSFFLYFLSGKPRCLSGYSIISKYLSYPDTGLRCLCKDYTFDLLISVTRSNQANYARLLSWEWKHFSPIIPISRNNANENISWKYHSVFFFPISEKKMNAVSGHVSPY